MLRSLYMGQDTQPETDRLNQKAGPSMQGLLSTSHWERLRACGGEGHVEVPDFAHFTWSGIKVFAAPDLAYVHDGVLHVIDWKTGREDDTQATQVLLQMWWALETYPELAHAAAEGSLEVRGYLEYVTAGADAAGRAAGAGRLARLRRHAGHARRLPRGVRRHGPRGRRAYARAPRRPRQERRAPHGRL